MPTAKTQAPEPIMAATKADLAMVYGCSEKHIDTQLARGAPRKIAPGRFGPERGGQEHGGGYDLRAWGEWWRADGRYRRLGGQSGGPEPGLLPGLAGDDGEPMPGTGDVTNWRQRRDRAEALLAELKVRELMGVYAKREDVDRCAARDFTTLRLLLETIPDRCAALVPRAQQDVVLDGVRDAIATTLMLLRTALARWSGRDRPQPLGDLLEAAHEHLENLPERIAQCVRGERQRERMRRAGRALAGEIRTALAAAVVGEWDGEDSENADETGAEGAGGSDD